MTRNVTHTSMIYTDGTTVIFGVYHARLHRAHRPTSEQYIDMRTAVQIGRVVWTNGVRTFDYLGASEQHATPQHPAFAWPAETEGRTVCPLCNRGCHALFDCPDCGVPSCGDCLDSHVCDLDMTLEYQGGGK